MNVVAVIVILLSMIPVYFAQRLTQDPEAGPVAGPGDTAKATAVP